MKKQSEQPTEEGQEAKPKTSRRELLRLGGAAVVGAAGMAAVTATPVSANSGGNMILGQTNTADAITILEPTTTGAIPMLEVLAHNASVPPSASQGLFAPIQGFGQTGGYDGVDGWAPGSFGYGVSGQSDSGYGVVGATLSGVDLAAFGTGRIVQAKNISTAGPPSYTPLNFEQVRDVNGVMWINLLTGWVPVQVGSPASLFTAVSTLQYSLANSDGKTWQDMDATNLMLSITPAFNCQAILTANADLWTANAGYNQDIGISVSGGAYPTVSGQPEGWKESGGFAGTFSPNAAYLQVVVRLVAATAYTIKVQWKTNKSASGVKIHAGAGPINDKFSPTRLTAQLVVSD